MAIKIILNSQIQQHTHLCFFYLSNNYESHRRVAPSAYQHGRRDPIRFTTIHSHTIVW